MPQSATADSDSAACQFVDGGRQVLFVSRAANLVPNDTNAATDVFVWDHATRTISLISVNRDGTGSADAESGAPVSTPDGRWVLFESRARNLVAHGLVEGAGDLYVRDRESGITRLISATPEGKGGQSAPANASITPDGRYVVFESRSPFLTSTDGTADTNHSNDVFIRDLHTDTTVLVSHPWDRPGEAADGSSQDASVSADGRYVAYCSTSSNIARYLQGGIRPGEVYVRDMLLGTNLWISTNAYALQRYLGILGVTPGLNPTLSADGQFIAYRFGRIGQSMIVRQNIADGTTVLVATNVVTKSLLEPDGAGPLMSADGRFIAWVGSVPGVLFGRQTQVYLWDAASGETIQIAVPFDAVEPVSASSDTPAMTPDGRFVAFLSAATNLVATPVNGLAQLYVRDLESRSTTLASAGPDGLTADGFDGACPVLSQDGHQIAFQTRAPTLVPNDFNRAYDVFVRNLTTDATALVSANMGSHPSATAVGPSDTTNPGLSADATQLAFVSLAPNLTLGDHNDLADVFLRDLTLRSTRLITHRADAAESADGLSRDPAISSDGLWVAFGSFATNLATDAADTNAQEDLFIHHVPSGITRTVSVAADTTGTGDKASAKPSLSSDGTRVAFQSRASNLVAHDANTVSDVFVRDLATPATHLVSVAATNDVAASATSESPVISPDGRRVVFTSQAGNLVDPPLALTKYSYFARDLDRQATHHLADGADLALGNSSALPAVISADSQTVVFPWRNGQDLYLHSLARRQTTLLCLNCIAPQLSANGRYAVYVSTGNGVANVYRVDTESAARVLVSVSTNAVDGGNGPSRRPLLSPDGRFVVFQSEASNLAGNDTNTWADVFVRDLTLGATLLVSANPSGQSGNRLSFPVAMGADGRTVLFASYASDLVPQDDNHTKDLFALRLNYGDLDEDGLPDDWEVTYFNNLTHDGSTDSDGDGAVDRAEYEAGTNPSNDTSVLRALTVQDVGTGSTTILWTSVAGRQYRVEFKDYVEDPGWQPLPGADVTANGPQASAFDTSTSGVDHRFYRVRLLNP